MKLREGGLNKQTWKINYSESYNEKININYGNMLGVDSFRRLQEKTEIFEDKNEKMTTEKP